jgi:hypothetical protein
MVAIYAYGLAWERVSIHLCSNPAPYQFTTTSTSFMLILAVHHLHGFLVGFHSTRIADERTHVLTHRNVIQTCHDISGHLFGKSPVSQLRYGLMRIIKITSMQLSVMTRYHLL